MKRFVSYLYSIYNNQRIHNAGFARVEIRTGRSRIDIHLKENGYAGKTGTVYLFIKKQENIQGISIGNIIFHGNQADFRYEQPEENIGQTSMKITQMQGILIRIDEQTAFLSQWDEQPVDTSRFEEWEKTEAAAGRSAQMEAGRAASGHLTEQAGDAEEGIEQNYLAEAMAEQDTKGRMAEQDTKGRMAEQDTRGRMAEAMAEQDTRGRMAEQDTRGWMAEQDTKGRMAEGSAAEDKRTGLEKMNGENDVSMGYYKENNENKISNRYNWQDETQNIPMGLEREEENEDLLNTDNPDLQSRPDLQSQMENSLESTASDIRTAELQPQRQVQNQRWEQTWRYMLRTYPVMNQFREEDGVLCVRIEIKDVRLLPEKYWSTINNSFLLHGFFNYRHLAFGRIGQSWFIGVPGIYQNQEHAMASIFGFPDFISQAQRDERGDRIGYWYRILEI